jgi:glycosyltransferase involved in cell wall biosynthesis
MNGMKPINVLVVSSKYPPEYAGSGLRAHKTYKRLSQRFPVTFEVLTSSITSNRSKVYSVEGVKVTRIAKKPFPKAKSRREERGNLIEDIKNWVNYLSEAVLTWKYLILNIKRFDLIHVFGKIWVTAAAVTFAKIFNKPLIIELCNDMPTPHQYEPKLFSMIFGRRFPEGTNIICISEKLRQMCEKKGYRENVWCRPNPVSEKRFFIDRDNKIKLREKYTPFRADDILLVYISYFITRKNQIFLLDIMKDLPENYKLLLAGPTVPKGPFHERDKNYLEDIKRKITEYGLGSRVRVEAKLIDNVDEYLKMSDAFLFPTKEDALGTPMLEALSCGLPVIANRISGVTDYWIKDGKNGYISGLNAEEFAGKVKMALGISASALKQNREELISRCSTEVIDSRYFDLLKKTAKRE